MGQSRICNGEAAAGEEVNGRGVKKEVDTTAIGCAIAIAIAVAKIAGSWRVSGCWQRRKLQSAGTTQ